MKKLLFVIGALFLLTLTAGGILAYKYIRRPEPPAPAPSFAEDITVTLIEGWTLSDMGEYLENKDLATEQEFLAAARAFNISDYDIVSLKPSSQSLEGYVFPDTYRIPKIPSSATSSKANSEAVLKRALQNFELKITDQMTSQAAKLGLNFHELITLASIVEKETGRNVTSQRQREALDTERRTIAGIFYNRLGIDMALQSDATVNYVTGKSVPAASLKDIETDSPYNTYKYKGLPPGPIANPSLSSIEAVLNPIETNYLYFLHKQPSGQVMYAATFEEHIRNKNAP